MNIFTFQLDPRQSGFSPVTARALAWASRQSYESATFTDARLDVQALWIEREDYAVIAFRGSDSIRDWMTNVDFAREYIPNSAHANLQVHEGFYDALDAVYEQCHLAVSKLAGRPLFITGHSQGGALALLFAYLIARCGIVRIAGVYTYGAPRLGNKPFCRAYNALLKERTFNLVNAADPIPLLPPLLAGYRDCGTEIFLPVLGGYVTDPFIGFELISDTLGLFAGRRLARAAGLIHHDIRLYEARCEALAAAHFNDDTNAADFQTP